jgi:hypothetical protein
MSSKLPVVLFLTAVVIASVAGSTLPANALIKRDYYYLNNQHLTARYGNTAVCGDHICTPGEWEKLQSSLTAAQLGHQGGRNATQTAATPSAPAPTPTPTEPASVCQSIKSILSTAGVSSNTVAKVMADLGCS